MKRGLNAGLGKKVNKTTAIAKGLGPVPHSDIVAYGKSVHHANKPSRGSTKSLAR